MGHRLPACFMNSLHILQGVFVNPARNSCFKFLKRFGIFFSVGTLSHNFGPTEKLKSLYTTCKALSWSLLMRAFSFRLWNIHVTVQYEKSQITKELIISLLCSKFIDDASLDRALIFWFAFLYKEIQYVL